MSSSRSPLQTAEARPAPTTHWRSTFAFVKDQLLEFWPPYRLEVHGGQEASGDPSPGKSEKPTRQSP
jgi:hypothetical protein